MTRLVHHTLAFAALVACAATARGDVWRDAADGGAAAKARQAYDRALADADGHVHQANACMVSPNERRRQIETALDLYKQAAAARPDAGEPHYRAAMVMDAFYVCSSTERLLPRGLDPEECETQRSLCTDATFKAYAPRVIAELDTFEARAPLDPRLTVVDGSSATLFTRALVETKLASPGMLAAAARDYERILARSDTSVNEVVLSNLAETYMMLDRLDDAVDKYLAAVNAGGLDASFGLAVALDRNGQVDRARDVLQGLGEETIRAFHTRVRLGETFFVPYGEVFYYEALIEESRHNDQIALEEWRAYLKSGAHPEFQPNAQAHVNAILKRLARKPPSPPVHDLDYEF